MPLVSARGFSSVSAPTSMPGTGRWAPSRYSTMMARVNRTLFRRSGTLKMFFRLVSTELAPVRRCGEST